MVEELIDRYDFSANPAHQLQNSERHLIITFLDCSELILKF